MQKTALIVAGGSGTRMRTSLPKQFIELGGSPILLRTIRRFLNYDPDLQVVVALPAAHLDLWESLILSALDAEQRQRVQACTGGATRTLSVWAGLETLAARVNSPAETLVAIQDGVRPFISLAMLDDAYDKSADHGAAVACVPVKASLRYQQADGTTVAVDRSEYWEVQTPQTFRLDLIVDAFKKRPHDNFTDDASLYQAMGGKVVLSDGSYDNIKVTTPEDLFVAERILKR
ncbi:MAG: 2-C-methyl-D-erythritol 4-phosphate cytidylyltransferase [Bacteroidota bacterium]